MQVEWGEFKVAGGASLQDFVAAVVHVNDNPQLMTEYTRQRNSENRKVGKGGQAKERNQGRATKFRILKMLSALNAASHAGLLEWLAVAYSHRDEFHLTFCGPVRATVRRLKRELKLRQHDIDDGGDYDEYWCDANNEENAHEANATEPKLLTRVECQQYSCIARELAAIVPQQISRDELASCAKYLE